MNRLIMGTLGCIAIWAFPALAQEGGIPQDVKQSIADDLMRLQKTLMQSREAAPVASPRVSVPMASQTMGLKAKSWVSVVTDRANVRQDASLKAPITAVAEEGQKFPVLAEKGDWYAVKSGSELGWLNKSVAKPVAAATSETLDEWLYVQVVEQVSAMKKKYENNPYVAISGFDVNIGIPPSVSVSFTFKP